VVFVGSARGGGAGGRGAGAYIGRLTKKLLPERHLYIYIYSFALQIYKRTCPN